MQTGDAVLCQQGNIKRLETRRRTAVKTIPKQQKADTCNRQAAEQTSGGNRSLGQDTATATAIQPEMGRHILQILAS